MPLSQRLYPSTNKTSYFYKTMLLHCKKIQWKHLSLSVRDCSVKIVVWETILLLKVKKQQNSSVEYGYYYVYNTTQTIIQGWWKVESVKCKGCFFNLKRENRKMTRVMRWRWEREDGACAVTWLLPSAHNQWIIVLQAHHPRKPQTPTCHCDSSRLNTYTSKE